MRRCKVKKLGVSLESEKLYKKIQKGVLSGAKTPHNTSYPIIYRENDKYYLAVFVFFYKREDIKAGAVERPTVWAIADIVTGDIIEERQARENDFSDARYDVKYNIRSETKHDTSKQYYTDAFAILDAVRSNLICAGTLCEQGYRMYLDKIVANVPEEYKRFYKDLSV